MTAEIAIMNREAVVLAADSAVTAQLYEREKISTEANKLFSLNNNKPIGIMIFGNSRFMDLPWETIIKIYKKKTIDIQYSTISDYANDFISFLTSQDINIRKEDELVYIDAFIFNLLDKIGDRLNDSIRKEIRESDDFTEEKIQEITKLVLKRIRDEVKDDPQILSRSICNEVLKLYSEKIKKINELIKEYLNIFNLSRSSVNKISRIIISQLQRINKEISSGVVIAGFGDDEVIPSVKTFHIEGIVNGKLKYCNDPESSLQNKNLRGAVLPFAQDEMVHNFMTGVNPLFMNTVIGYVVELCEDYTQKILDELKRYTDNEKADIKVDLEEYSEKRIRQFVDYSRQFAEEQFVNPVVEAVSRLPRSELAVLAESLVHLTSIKRKMSPDAETVGGPIDVAVITKGDGFVWIKRKHYFKPELNPNFFIRNIKETLNVQDV